jgi:subtilase family serine protease
LNSKASFLCLISAFLAPTFSANAVTPGAIDHGALATVAGATPISVTITLALPHLNEAEDLQRAIYTPGDPQYHRFLTAQQFATTFAPSDADFANAIAGFAKYNLTAQKTTATTLQVTGLPADMEKAFSVSLHGYEVPANGNVRGYTFHAPLNPPAIPAEVGVPVAGIAGLDSSPTARPHIKRPAQAMHAALPAAASSSTGNPPGYLTVTDFAQYYDVEPLYKQGVTGAGRTLGIMTLASFTPSDAFAYWDALKLKVAKNRIKIVNIDGGPGAPSDASSSDETTLDVEQSGGIAPSAKVIVYQAPNTNQGFVDMFAKAIDDNTAESLSTSWGDWEWLSNLENSAVTDPITGRTVSSTTAIHELLLRAAIQGQSTFAAAGDGGAYDANDSFGCFPPYSASNPGTCTLALSVDYPASDSLITASGGTTLPGIQEYCLNSSCTSLYKINIKHESVWGWDYLNGLCTALGYPNPIACGTFPGGGGGGVSVAFIMPWYQIEIPGVELSQPNQVFQAAANPMYDQPAVYYALPSHFPGRNVPDISFNADPETGYVLYYTSNVNGFEQVPFYGGTSFVGPQLNGVTALLGQYAGQRIGLWNPTIYGLAASGQGYRGKSAPFNAIAYGDNWFYHGSNGYNLGAGLGTLDVANFASLLNWYY